MPITPKISFSQKKYLYYIGVDLWHGFLLDLANGTSDYQHGHPIPEAVADIVHPTFEALSNESLRSRCLHGGTQNQNEAINAMIWLVPRAVKRKKNWSRTA